VSLRFLLSVGRGLLVTRESCRPRLAALGLGQLLFLLSLSACRREPERTAPTEPDRNLANLADADAVTDPDAEGRASRSVETRADEARRERDPGEGRIDPHCEGTAIDVIEMVLDARCALSEGEWAAMSAHLEAGVMPGGTAGAGMLRQEARREEPGDGLLVSIVNRGSAPVVVPLRLQPGSTEHPAFSVFAETEGHAIVELAPPGRRGTSPSPSAPRPAAPRGRTAISPPPPLPIEDAGVRADGRRPEEHVYSARVRLLPGGALRARIVVDTRIVRRLDRACSADAADCTGRLGKGHHTLHVGQLVTPLDVGSPARVAWEIP
jgi:hypothetical protein